MIYISLIDRLGDENGDHGTEMDIDNAIKSCSASDFQKYMHQAQDYYTHYGKGYRAWDFTDWEHLPPGHMWYGTAPDEDKGAWDSAENLTQRKLQKWNEDCCLKCPKKKCIWVPKSSGECAK